MSVIEMSVQEWINIPDNPRQRNTERRAQSAARGHLSEYCPIHRYVYAAVKDGNVLCKLDGHTRAYLWHEGILDLPTDSIVEVLLINVTGLADAKRVYDQLDSPSAVCKPADTIFGATRENNFSLHSPMLRGCRFTTQLKVATTGTKFSGDPYAMIKEWKPYLIELDKLNLSDTYSTLTAVMFCVSAKTIHRTYHARSPRA